MSKVGSIARNTSFFTLALVIQKVISFSYFAIMARNLNPESLGKYYFAISFTTIFAILMDFGLSNVLTREVAKKPEQAEKMLGAVLAVKVPLSLLACSAVFFSLAISGKEADVTKLVTISAVCMVLDSFATTFFATIRGFHNLKYESLSAVFFQVVSMAFGLFFIYKSWGLNWIMSSLVLASISNLSISVWSLVRVMGVRLIFNFDRSFIKKLIIFTLPFAVYAIFQRLYTYLDTVLLSYWAGDREAGIYQVAFKVIFALQFLPNAFTASLYPAMSDYWLRNKEQLKITFERAFNYLAVISLPISLGVIAISDEVVSILKSGYADAVWPMRITMLSVFFNFVNFPIGSLLNACDQQKRNTRNMIIVFSFSLLSNIILIPKYKALGASLTVLFSTLLMFILGIVEVGKLVDYRKIVLTKIFLKSLAASLLMCWLVILFKKSLGVFLVVPLAGIIYFYLVFLLGAFRREDLLSIIKSFRRKKGLEENI